MTKQRLKGLYIHKAVRVPNTLYLACVFSRPNDTDITIVQEIPEHCSLTELQNSLRNLTEVKLEMLV